MLLRLLRGEDETLFQRELCDLSGGNLSAVSEPNALVSCEKYLAIEMLTPEVVRGVLTVQFY